MQKLRILSIWVVAYIIVVMCYLAISIVAILCVIVIVKGQTNLWGYSSVDVTFNDEMFNNLVTQKSVMDFKKFQWVNDSLPEDET